VQRPEARRREVRFGTFDVRIVMGIEQKGVLGTRGGFFLVDI